MKEDTDATSPSTVSSGVSRAGSQAGIAHHNSPANVSLSSSNTTSALISINTSTTTATTTPNATSLQVPLPPTTQAGISVSAASTMAAPSLFFSRNVEPEPFVYVLPGPNEPLQNTRQLAHCLALLQPSTPEDGLPPVMLKWRRDTQANLDEKNRLEALPVQIIETFDTDARKDASAVTEVVQLTPVLSNDHFRFVLKTLTKSVNDSEILPFHLLDGLAKVIQGASPGSIDSDDIVTILRSLHSRLQSIHSASHHHRLHLLLTVSRVLDAMADAHTEDVDRIDLYEPLTDLLRKSGSKVNPYLTFQAAYATQALLNVSDDENFWRTVFRHIWLVLKDGTGIVKISDPTEIKDALESLEKVYKAAKGGALFLMKALEAIKDREPPTFTVREGLKFRRAWYRAIRMAELYIQAGRLVLFKELVTTVSCRDQFLFQWGICQLLGQFAADTRWNLEARREAVAFLEALSKDDSLWKRQKVDQVIFDVLTNLTSKHAQHFEAAKPVLEEMRKQKPSLKHIADLQSPIWSSMRPADPTRPTASNVTLLKAAQDKITRRAKLASLPAPFPKPSLDDIHSALNAYHAPDLVIRRVSGDELDLETCFINLAIVEASAQREKEKENLKEQATAFHRMKSFESVKNTNKESLIPLDRLFDKHKLRNGTESTPRRILVQGRAGIGKTTLCKKLVHAYQSGLWEDKFDSVLWIPLRRLRGFNDSTLERLFRKKVFITQGSEEHQQAMAKALVTCAEKGKVLFILDGMDEIVADTEGDDRSTFRLFLTTLLNQQHVIITSRPSGLDTKLLPQIDLELETVGFSQQNVNDFLVKVLEPDAARTVQDFIRHTPLIQGLVNIPVQLDVICFSWDSLPTDGAAVTMTGLYQLMEYFAATWIVRHFHRQRQPYPSAGMMTMEKMASFLQQHKCNPQFEIVWSMVAGLLEGELLSDFFELLQGSPRDLIGGRHQLILASCLNEARARLNSTVVAALDTELASWMHFEMETCQHSNVSTSILGSQLSFPEAPLVKALNSECSWRSTLANTLRARSVLSDSAIQCLIVLLKDDDERVRLSAATALSEQPTLSESVTHYLISEAANDDKRFPWSSAAMALGRETCSSFIFDQLMDDITIDNAWMFELEVMYVLCEVYSKQTIQYLTAQLTSDDKTERSSAASRLGLHITLPRYSVQSLITALQDDYEEVRGLAALSLGRQSTLSESAVQSLIAELKHGYTEIKPRVALILKSHPSKLGAHIPHLLVALKDDDWELRSSVASALGGLSELSETALESLVAALKDEVARVRKSVASALGQQPRLPVWVIQALIPALKDEDESVRDAVRDALQRHCIPLGNSLPYLTKDEISCFYEHHLFIYSCSHVLTLQEQGDNLCVYTEQGATQLGPITNDQKEIIVSAFRTVQRKAGIKT
ncbi:hypothetical protein EMPS_10790 [Entomortierella parvispora]|uniref:NACHT domain-containing protein n=1 Tax=Entomortierella parvispora TaxID=205924 RepID=A0A9P3M1C4_9FUNG|nr:hypothetical protein EMPS_10790 [Entomortierella parvispora]